MAAVCQPRPNRSRTAASASAAGSPASSGAASRRAPSPSTSSTDSCAARPRTTIASFPVNLPAMANRLDASASVSRPVSGDLATTANFALVVSGVPTNGENTNARGAAGASGSTPVGARRCSSHVPSPTPPKYARRTASSRASGTLVAPRPSTFTTRACPKYPPTGTTPRVGALSAARAPGKLRSAARVGGQEGDRVTRDERELRVAGHLVAVDGRDDVPVEGDAHRRGGRAERG